MVGVRRGGGSTFAQADDESGEAAAKENPAGFR